MYFSVARLSDEQLKKLTSSLGLSDADYNSATKQKTWSSSLGQTPRIHLIGLWRNRLHPASYNYAEMLDEALRLVLEDNAVPSVEHDITHAEESTKDLLAELPDLNDGEVTLVASRLGLKKDDINSCHDSYDIKIELLKLWKRKIHPPLYHYRLELAMALKSMDNLAEHGQRVLLGKNEPGGPNRNVINDIYSNMSKAEVKRVADILCISGLKTADLEILMRDEERFRLQWNVMVDTLSNEGFSALAHELILLSCSSSSKEKSHILSQLSKWSPSQK
ncbi:uncharacterized protein [Diadema setosum]|uniref:uncharacterized protein n=1 Tax=Diadema setosum TaxID=31175 RepID=UPI003B3B6CA7